MLWMMVAALAMAGGPMPADESGQDTAVALARQTLAREHGIEPGRISLEDASAVDWPDAGLGCGEKGRMYAQVITPGYRVRLEADQAKYDVHVGGGRAVVCGAAAPAAAEPHFLAAASTLYQKARADLAARLKAADEDVVVN